MADERTYIKVHDGMPDHPKVDALSDAGFRLLMETWCWCSRHLTDGIVPLTSWRKRSAPKVRAELITAQLAHEPSHDCASCPQPPAGHVVMHDYLEHQRSAAEVAELRETKRKAGAKGNHKRWHIEPKGRPDPDCELCSSGDDGPSQMGSHMRSQPRPAGVGKNGHVSATSATVSDAHGHSGTTPLHGAAADHHAVGPAETPDSGVNVRSQGASHMRSQNDRKTSPETEGLLRNPQTETEQTPHGAARDVSPDRAYDNEPRHDEPPSPAFPDPSPGRAVVGPTSGDAYRFVDAAIGRDHPHTVRTALAIEVGEQLLAGTSRRHIFAALVLWLDKPHLGPKALPTLISEVIRLEGKSGGKPRQSATDTALAEVDAAFAAYEQQVSHSNVRALPRGA